MNKRRALEIGAIRKTGEENLLAFGIYTRGTIALGSQHRKTVRCIARAEMSGCNDTPTCRMEHSTRWKLLAPRRAKEVSCPPTREVALIAQNTRSTLKCKEMLSRVEHALKTAGVNSGSLQMSGWDPHQKPSLTVPHHSISILGSMNTSS